MLLITVFNATISYRSRRMSIVTTGSCPGEDLPALLFQCGLVNGSQADQALMMSGFCGVRTYWFSCETASTSIVIWMLCIFQSLSKLLQDIQEALLVEISNICRISRILPVNVLSMYSHI